MEIRPARWDDLEQVVELIGAQNRAAAGATAIRVEHLRSEWELPGFRLGEDNLVAANSSGRLAGYGAVTASHQLVLAAGNDALAEELLARVLARARGRGDETISVTLPDRESPLARLVARNGFALASETLVMWRDLAAPIGRPVAPEGIAFRTFEPADARVVHELLDKAYRGWDQRYASMAHEDWVSRMTGDSEFDPTVWWLAERDGALAGCALHWDSGWLKDVAVRDSERGQGLGAALVQLGLAEFARRGLKRVGLKVAAANPTGAVKLYERLGFVTARTEAVWVSSL